MPVPKPKTRDKVVEALMALAAEHPFDAVTLPMLAERAGITLAALRENYDGRFAVLAEYIRRVDERVLAGIDPSLAEESPRERLFDVLFSRFEAHAPHKQAIRGIVRAARRDPCFALELNRIVATSMGWMLAAAGISSAGGRGLLRAQGLALVWARVVRVWLDDEDAGLARTMAALDKRLREAERVVMRMDCLEKLVRRRGRSTKPARTAEVDPDLAEGHPT
jgi:AcrR family transcriptional regulator